VVVAAHWLPVDHVAPVAAALAMGKEFWLDLRPWFENSPRQTLLDSWRDFTGYATGILIGTLAHAAMIPVHP
jgi:hypothetical protein